MLLYVAQTACPRMIFVGENDKTAGAPGDAYLSELLRETEDELERLGWAINWIPDGRPHWRHSC